MASRDAEWAETAGRGAVRGGRYSCDGERGREEWGQGG